MARLLAIHLALFVLSVIATGHAQEDVIRVVGGTAVQPGEIPYQISLRVNGRHICGGSIISDKHIVTAAHCVYRIAVPPYQNMRVATGSVNINQGQLHEIFNVRIHPGYVEGATASWKNDIAVITLARAMIFNSYQRPIALPSRATPVNAVLTLSGWGKTSANGPLSTRLLRATLYAISNQQCQSTHRERILNTQLCALSKRGIGACQGDSGGPLTMNGELAGVVSWVYPCALGIADVFTRVYNFIDFIKSVQNDV